MDVNSNVELRSEPLPGYKLLEKIGAGGYGEVWRVEAPGGLVKAIKFVFGTENEKRATHELKALQRIRELRHPFLLSLERIEIVDHRLMVVTELAEGSLKDVFDAYQKQDLPGVPRDELLKYFRDAADALDYMSNNHGLQHLDIKPENLLIVGGHVKVADFGLVKDLQQSQASIVGGMTPLYSAPEVFRGRPSACSDQYSLAIVYQEMLTGMLPFSGATAAELTLQHLNDEPGLSPLSGTDRYVVARALSKEPTHRYASCSEFVQALMNSVNVAESPTTGAQPDARCSVAVPNSQRQNSATEVFDDEDVPPTVAPMLIDALPTTPVEVEELGRIDFLASEFQPMPTLFLGIGGTGASVLTHLRRKFAEQFGSADRFPSLQFLLLDTDPQSTLSAAREDHGLSPEEVLAIPLRRPQHYRDNSARLLTWLSRRWLYNMPKSMRTEGLRPLGRLALVDHARQACQRIRQSIALASDDMNMAVTRDTLGLPLGEGACRVYLVASIAGGTGSGTVLDLGYAVRAALAKLDIAHPQIVALLMHSTSRDPRHGDLARVNTYSWLNEYHHFVRPGSTYPGDSSCGLPAHPPGTAPFDDTYLLHLGEGLQGEEFDQATAMVADYLCLDSVTAAGAFFAACRRETRRNSGSQPDVGKLRSFGLQRISAAPVGVVETFAAEMRQRVLADWLTGRAHSGDEAALPDSDLDLNVALFATSARKLLTASLGGDDAAFLDGRLGDTSAPNRSPATPNQLAAVDQLFRKGESQTGGEAAALFVVNQPLAEIVAPLADEWRDTLSQNLHARLDHPMVRLAGTRNTAEQLVQKLTAAQAEARTLAAQLAGRLVTIRRAAEEPSVDEGTSEHSACSTLDYFAMRLDHCAMLAARNVMGALVAHTKTFVDELNQLARELTRLAGQNQPDTPTPRGSHAAGQGAVVDHLRNRLDAILAQIDRQMQNKVIEPAGGLMAAITAGGRSRAQLLATLNDTCHHVVEDALGEIDVVKFALAGDQTESPQPRIETTSPELLKFGGQRRTLAILPKSANQDRDLERVHQALGDNASLVPGIDNCLLLCVEAAGIPLAQVALDIVQRRRDYVEFAERVHARSDIRWSKITDQARQRPAAVEPMAGSTLVFGDTSFPTDPVSQA